MNDLVQSELKKIFDVRFSTSVSTRTNYARGEDTYDPVLSKAVVFPETNEEVSKVLSLCNKHKVPVVPFGTGTSLEGNVVGNEKGITISLEKTGPLTNPAMSIAPELFTVPSMLTVSLIRDLSVSLIKLFLSPNIIFLYFD